MEQVAIKSGITGEVEVRKARMKGKICEHLRDRTWEMPSDMG